MNQHRLKTCRVVLIAMGMVLLAGPRGISKDTSSQVNSTRDSVDKRFFLGYLSGGPDHINYALFTHICHAFVVADEEGRIVARTSVPSRRLTTEAHQANVKVILSLGGWGMDKEFAALTSKEESYERFVTSVMKMTDEYDYDGIDLDWEFPDNPTETKNFNRLARRFRRDLNALGRKKNRPFLLTMAVNASPGLSKWLDTDVLLETMDFINVMTYDFFGGWSKQAGHHSALFESSKAKGVSTQKAMAYWHQIKGMPKDKLLVGLPLYSRGFAAAKPYDTVNRDAPRPYQALAYHNLHQLIKDGWVHSWDDETKNPWLTSPKGDYVHSYDNEKSLALKTHWAIEQDYRGVFFWEIKQDRLEDGSNPLLEAAHKAMAE
jgi:chitinase